MKYKSVHHTTNHSTASERRVRRSREVEDAFVNPAYGKIGFGMNKAWFGLAFYMGVVAGGLAVVSLIINIIRDYSVAPTSSTGWKKKNVKWENEVISNVEKEIQLRNQPTIFTA